MYQVTIKGRNLDELKKAVSDIHCELSKDNPVINTRTSVTKNMEQDQEPIVEEFIHTTDEDLQEIKRLQNSMNEDQTQEVDKEGIPWDERIHSGNGKKTAKGVWQKRKGVDPATFTKIKAQLLSDYAGEEKVEVVQTSVTPAMTTPTLNNNVHSLATFTENFAMVIAQLVTANKLTEEYVQQLKSHFNIAEIWQASEEQIKATFDLLVQENIITQVG